MLLHLLAAPLLLQVAAVLPRLPLPRPSATAAAVAINDNRAPAGSLRGNVLALELEVVEARWRPEGASDPEVPVLAFAERGKTPTVPSPLVRAPRGTEVRLTLVNRTDSALVLGGLRPGAGLETDSVQLAARGRRELRFRLDSAGTFFYWGVLKQVGYWENRDWLDSQLSGAIVVDEPGARRDDRIFVITEWFLGYRDRPFESALVFNGKAWPNTERITLTQGDSVHWRMVNASAVPHPLHLHGFYFRVERMGSWGAVAPTIPVAKQPLQNVQLIPIGGTMSLSFVPTQPGNWVFHCHFADHVGGEVSLAGSPRDSSEIGKRHAHDDPSVAHQMRGLVIGIHVNPALSYAAGAPPVKPRELRLLAQRQPSRLIGNNTAYGFMLQRGDSVPARDTVALPGPVLELERGRPVRITVVNNLDEPTGVHWHGLEIESFPDGVPGWSGMKGRIMPPIMPRDSFVAEFTPPRSGTFLYHSHAHEMKQIGSGMYAAIIVTDAPRDTTRDHLVIAGGGGPPPFEKEAAVFGLVNGRRTPVPIRGAPGVTQRFRLVSIDVTQALEFALGNDSATVRWRAVAKDGADLPSALAVEGLARVVTGPGETYDFEWTPPGPGTWYLSVRGMRAASWQSRVPVIVEAPKGKAKPGS